jgi:uroporphyrinogen III methyltransferase / synthase
LPPVVACLGPVTAEAAREAGLDVAVLAAEPSAEGLVAGLAAYRAGRSSR